MRKIYISVKDGLPQKCGIWRRNIIRARRKALNQKRAPMQRLLGQRVRQLRASKSRAKRLVKTALQNTNIHYTYQKGFLCKGLAVRVVDFMLHDNRTFLEIDGPEHCLQADVAREAQILKSKPGYTFLRILNSEVFENADRLEEYLMDRLWTHKKLFLTPALLESNGGVLESMENREGWTRTPQSGTTIKPGEAIKSTSDEQSIQA